MDTQPSSLTKGRALNHLVATCLLAGALPVLLFILIRVGAPARPFINEPLHALLESAGAAAGFAVVSLLWLKIRQRRGEGHLAWVCAGLISMGTIDLAHAALSFGPSWSWTRHIATCVGGILFALTCVPVSDRYLNWRGGSSVAAFALSAALAILICRFGYALPLAYTAGGYTGWAKATNALGGLGFFASSVFFLRRYFRNPDREDLLFAGLTLVFAVSGFLFGLSGPWSPAWWMWHVCRFAAYAIAASMGYQLVKALHRELVEQKRTLQLQVERRTEALRLRSEALEASEQKFRRIFETANEGIWILDQHARIVLVNPRIIEMLGYAEGELVGHLKWEFVAAEQQSHVRSHFEQRRRGVVEQFEVRFCRKDGSELWALIAARPIIDNGQFQGTLDMITDNTERKRTELELACAEQRLRQHAATLEDRVKERTAQLQETVFHLESFSYSISHDMRAPLRAMTGYANELLNDYASSLPPDGRELLQRIRNAALRLDLLIRDILDYTRVSRGDLPLEQIDLSALLADIIRDYPELRQYRDNICSDCTGMHVYANRAAVTQCLSNLVGNAAKFVPPGIAPSIRIWCEQHNESVRLWVEDNGIGIPREQHENIFGVFQRLHSSERYPGTGIGLAIVKKAVERMNGKVGVDSELGKGSRFWIELPGASANGDWNFQAA